MSDPLVMSVPAYCASRFNLSKNAAYFAASKGDIPTVRVGGKIFVPVRVADEKFGLAVKAPEAA